jgi:uncharacterized protein YqhQ
MKEYLQYGGQAVIEGVMMRSPRFFAVACRKPDKTIVVKTEPVEHSIVGKLKWLNKPFLRGTLALVDAMALGTKALAFAAKVQSGEIGAAGNPAVQPAGNSSSNGSGPVAKIAEETGSRINDIAIGATMVFAFCFGIGVFIALPTLLTQLTQKHLGVHGSIPLNITDGVIRITIFLAYISAIGQMENIRRVFQYHGAEHKAINALESGEELNLDNSLKASRIHPRCGTSFIIVVLISSILVHSVFPRPENYFVRLALHLSLIPVVAGAAYEVIRLAGRFRNLSITRILLAPGLWSQQLTTREPAAEHVEVALAALNAVLEQEKAVKSEDANAVEAPEAAAAAVA